MLFNGRALIFTFSGTQVRIAEIERLQSLFKMSMASTQCVILAMLIWAGEECLSQWQGRTIEVRSVPEDCDENSVWESHRRRRWKEMCSRPNQPRCDVWVVSHATIQKPDIFAAVTYACPLTIHLKVQIYYKLLERQINRVMIAINAINLFSRLTQIIIFLTN